MEEQEIDLRDYLRVLKRKWKLIVRITVGCAIVSAVYSLFLPPVYESSAIIEPAKTNKVPVETSTIAELLFKNPLNPYLKNIAKQMDVREKKAYCIAEKFRIADKVGYIQITGKEKTPADAKKLVDIICLLMMERHKSLVKDAIEIINDEVASLEKHLASTIIEAEQINKKLLSKENATAQGQGYIFQGLIESRENALKRQTELEERLRAKQMELKYYTKNALVIAEASLPLIKSGTSKRNIVAIATIFGFFISVFFVFVVDYFQKNPL